MGVWVLAVVVVAAMLGLVVVGLWHGRVDERVGPEPPDWLLPTPRELAEVDFPLAWQGYDPDHVDAWLRAVREAYEELWFALGPSGVAQLEERLEARREGAEPAQPGWLADRVAGRGTPDPAPVEPPGTAATQASAEPEDPLWAGRRRPRRRADRGDIIPKVTVRSDEDDTDDQG